MKGKLSMKESLFFSLLISLTTGATLWIGKEISFYESSVLSLFWLFGFGFLFLNVTYLFLIGIIQLLTAPKTIPESYIEQLPKTAICYFVRNEEHGLFERMKYSFGGNKLPATDFWILSDSDEVFEPEERRLQLRLEEALRKKVFYRRRNVPSERKQGNLREFILSHTEYEFLYVADADSMVPEKTVLTLLKKAAHPANEDIAVFQTFIKTAHAKTYYARFEGIAAESSQKFHFSTIQSFFGRSISFGHQHLLRRKCFESVELPQGLLSHDNWDTVLLDEAGYRVVFVPDVVTFDEAPANYLESRRREARWAQGTLQGIPLIYRKGLSPIIRFLSFYGIYCYLAQPVFLAWLITGLLSQSYFMGEFISFRTDAIWFGCPVNQTLTLILLFSIAVNFFYKCVIVRTVDDLKKFLYEVFFSTLIFAGNFFYTAFEVCAVPFKRLIWKPMKKNPFEEISWSEAANALLPGTIFGLMGIWYLIDGTPHPHLASLPIFLSLTISIPAVYLSSKTAKERGIYLHDTRA